MNHPMPIDDTRVPTVADARRKPLAMTIERRWVGAVLLRALMLVLGLFRSVMPVAGAALLIACTTPDESAVDCLPEPSPRRVDPPAYTDEQQARKEEVDQFLCDRYQEEGWQILETTQTYGGDIIDWLDPASVPGSQVDPPPPIPASEYEPLDGELQVTELDQFPELRAEAGIPVTRPTFEAYIQGWTDAVSLEDFLSQQEGGMPAGQTRLYVGLTTMVDNWGGAGRFTPFAGTVEEGTFSLLELAVACDGPDKDNTLELVGIVASQDKKHFDGVVRLQVEFFADGVKYGDEKGGWHGFFRGFVPFEGAAYGPGLALVPLSTPGGKQYGSYFKILRAQNGDWWLAHNGHWLGYYPATLFDLINTKACDVSWYGEVLDTTPTDRTETDMGSGEFAINGFGYASSIANMTYYDTSGAQNAPSSFGTMGPTDPACYTKSDLFADALGVPYFILGGPGGDAPGCD